MKTVFDPSTRDEITGRIHSLNENSRAQWGKMNVHQMLRHCILADEMFLGKKKYKRVFLGRLFGRIGLRSMLKDDRPLRHNSPTSESFKVRETTGEIGAEKQKWISLIEEYSRYKNDNFQHWFFGKMTPEQVGRFVYKHCDHHLRQFGS
jgi:hypothetical protein